MSRTTPSYDRERTHGGVVAGVDEVGRGSWAGPVVAAAVILDSGRIPQGLADSKRLGAARRQALAAALHETAIIGIGAASVAEIDQHNILRATHLAMQRAVAALSARPELVLVDGNRAPSWAWPCETVVGGDACCASIAAASIVAKVHRDQLMVALHDSHPVFGWATNMGYGTAAHAAALARFGPTPQHRMSFAPVARAHELGAESFRQHR